MYRPFRLYNLRSFSAFQHGTLKTVALIQMGSLLLACFFPVTAVMGQTKKAKAPKKIGKIFIVSPKTRPLAVQGGSIPLKYNVNDPDITSVKIKVGNKNGDSDSGTADLSDALVYLFEGVNTIEVLGFKGTTLDPQATETFEAECLSQCISGFKPPGGMVQSGSNVTRPPAGPHPGARFGPGKNIVLRIPGDGTVTDVATVEPVIVVQERSGITRLLIDVYQNGAVVESVSENKINYQDGLAILKPTLKIRGGVNDIHVYDPLHFGQQGYETRSQIECKGAKCAPAGAPVAVNSPSPGPSPTASPTTSPNTPAQQPNVADSQKGSIHIAPLSGEVKYVDETSIPLKLSVDPKSDPKKNVKSVFITVTNETATVEQSGGAKEVSFPDPNKAAELTANVKVAKGTNTILVYDPTRPDDERHSITVVCDGKKCEAPAVASQKTPKIKVDKPEKGSKEAEVIDVGRVDSYLTIANDSKIENIQYTVYNGDIVHTSEKFPVPAAEEKKPIKMRIPLAILKGTNTVRFFDAANPGSNEDTASTVVICKGENCPTDYLVAKFPSSGQNSRVIVGIEQAGGSSATSETKPVVDLFFMTPFMFDRRKQCGPEPVTSDPNYYKLKQQYDECIAENSRRRLLPRFGFWGDIRLAATPDQIAAAQVFPASLVNQVDKPGKFIDLVQSFDFLAGLEGRLITGNGSFLSLVPGIRQKTSLYLAFGGGAISPLTVRREGAQIFKIPVIGDPQRDEFISRFGEPPAQPVQTPALPAKEFLGIVPIDRDRFLRQWYLGLRLKTLYCENTECTRYKNSFPAIVDVMIGQNEAVTGGSRKRGGTPDPNNPEKLIGRKNSYVLRIDGFYPFPIREANFLFFYGTALMKIGGGGVRVTTPLFLDNPGTTVELSDPRVYIPPINILKLQQPDRDYYKIGVGVNLTDLFNRNKPRSQ